ncbi:MAG: riboflavin biosynthesis protein RibF [bacterium]|nr:riboflavin biosynthesis protein RibF [bacterium]
MKVLYWPNGYTCDKVPSVGTIGVFDGLHRGHRHLIEGMLDNAKRAKLLSTVVTFDPHPQMVVGGLPNPVKLLIGIEERLSILASLGVERTIVCQFTRDLSMLSAEEFLKELIRSYGIERYYLGPNHAFGYKRSGNRDTLPTIAKSLGINIDWAEPVQIDGTVISSSAIRKLLLTGDIETANHWLGRPFTLSGYVVAGERRGRELGVPTANLQVEPSERLIPADGVYIARVNGVGLNGHPSLLSIGTRPTFGNLPRAIEAHLFDYNATIYGQRIEISFLQFLRGQVTYPNAEELIAQMKDDEEKARKYFAK